MFTDLKKLLTTKFILIFSLIILLYFLTRLINLTLIPVFVDEAIYIRWSQVMRAEPTLRFLPLSDGKQPLFMWLTIPFLKFFSDPLFAGRLVSVFAGFGSLLGISAITWFISRSARAIYIVALLYILTPFTFFFDRMALADSLLSMFGIWSLFLGLLLVHFPRLDLALLLGFSVGGAVLTKSPGWYFLLLQPFLLLTAAKLTRKKLLKLSFFWLISTSLSFAIYNILRLGPNFHLIALRNADYVFPFSEVIKHPLNPFLGHFTDTLSWTISLLTLSAIVIFLLPFKKPSLYKFTLFLWFLLPVLFQAAIAKAYTSRYFLFAIPPLLVIIALKLESLHKLNRRLWLLALAAIILVPSFTIFRLLTDPPAAPIPQNMKYGYFQEWTAGYGQKEAAQYLKERAKTSNLVVGTEGYFGTLPDGLQIYTEGITNIVIIGIGQPVNKIPDSLKAALAENEVYLLVNHSRNSLPPIDLQNHLRLISEYPKPARPNGTREILEFYQVLP